MKSAERPAHAMAEEADAKAEIARQAEAAEAAKQAKAAEAAKKEEILAKTKKEVKERIAEGIRIGREFLAGSPGVVRKRTCSAPSHCAKRSLSAQFSSA
jgi:hypothetical protein